jgi:hypothetical protein
LSIALYKHLPFLESVEKKISAGIVSFFSIVNIILIILGIGVSFYLIKTIYRYLRDKRLEQKRRKELVYYSKKECEKIIEKYSLNEISTEKYIEKLKDELATLPEAFELSNEKVILASELIKAEKSLIEKKHEERIMGLEDEKEDLEREIRLTKEYDQKAILRSLDLSNRVFWTDKLDKKEIKALVEERYLQVNEYCVFRKKIISVLVKPIGNHSIAHTFLVWSVRELLESFGIEDIEERLTVDADLIFKFDKKKYALEIECGSLVRKKDQLKEKIEDLNKKYPNRWMFIVSHRDLLKKYKKVGVTATRANTKEKLEKMLKIAHPN